MMNRNVFKKKECEGRKYDSCQVRRKEMEVKNVYESNERKNLQQVY